MSEAPSKRTTLRRAKNRAHYAREDVKTVLAAGVVAHVGVNTDDGPMVLPMAYGVDDDNILIHGAVANAMMRAGRSLDVCVTVTIIDGLVIGRTPFHNSMNYRSVVVRGTATAIDDPAKKTAALRTINNHLAPIWETGRPPSDSDFKKTLVLSIPLAEASAKIRAGDPVDEDQDLDGPHWAGVVPLTSTWGQAYSASDLRVDAPIPEAVLGLSGSNAHSA
ncbi:MAG: pyridoxamine 5'-phosphate oxidase family protein [Acidimicrobiales bacterium]